MKEELFKKGIKKRLFSVVLALAMVVALMPMGSVMVYAADYNSGNVVSSDLAVGDTFGGSVTFSYAENVSCVLCRTCQIITFCEDNYSLRTAIKNQWDSGDHIGHNVLSAVTVSSINNMIKSWKYTFTVVYANGTTSPTHEPDDDSAKSQPKTGVMDTLPMWFGVMAVSAAAYVLTSKKRFF